MRKFSKEEPEEPQTPQGWRDLLRASHQYPEEFKNVGRRQRRRAKKVWRQESRDRSSTWVREQREREPLAGGIALTVLLIMFVTFAIAAKFGTAEEKHSDSTSSPHPSDTIPAPPAKPSYSSPEVNDSSSPSSTPSVPEPVLKDPEKAAKGFLHVYLHRFPRQDKGIGPSIERASSWMSDTLEKNLKTHPDLYYQRLVANGAAESSVKDIKLEKLGSAAPPDNKYRVQREAKINISVAGREKYNVDRKLQLEVARGASGDWHVTELRGINDGQS